MIDIELVKVRVSFEPDFAVSRTLRFVPSYGMTMLETSKPIYQPGEILKFRAIGFDGWMKPWSESFESVSVYNAEGSKVMEWRKAQLENGLSHYRLPLAQYNTEGTWRIVGITKSGETIVKFFQVSNKGK